MNRVLSAVLFVILLPAACAESSVLITVVDPLNNLVDGASLQMYCDQIRQSGITNQFGTYYVTLPNGSCKAYARFKDAVGVMSFSPEKTPELTISLDKTIIMLPQKTIQTWPFIIVLVIIVLVVVSYFLKNKKIPKSERKVHESKINAVLDVLTERERQIVKHLLQNNGQSTQSKIRYETGLPKASISRNIKNLEAKNVISVHAIGNFKRITLKK